MRRAILLCCFFLTPMGCVVPNERAPLSPLPDKVTALPYAELLTRARTQARQANEAFYVDRWEELEDAAKGLEQTARFLARADDVPAKHKDTLALAAGDLGKESIKLRESAVARDVKAATRSLQRINLQVRQLRLSD